MPSIVQDVQNNFTKGLLTEFTGLNFPENAATDTENCEYTLIGDVLRREGIDFEVNSTTGALQDRTGQAISTYRWSNVGGDGTTQFLVVQIGSLISFYNISTSTQNSPLSSQLLSTNVDMTAFTALNGTFDPTVENQYSDGNGYLFIFNSNCDPVYVAYNSASQACTGQLISLQIRDFDGLNDGLGVTTRPSTLSTEHNYNLQNQGWTSANSWITGSSTVLALSTNGSYTFTVGASLPVTLGGIVEISANVDVQLTDPNGNPLANMGTLYCTAVGTVTAYSGTTLTVNVYSINYAGSTGGVINPPALMGYGTRNWLGGQFFGSYSFWTIVSINTSVIVSWNTAEGNFPSNADVWWYFKDTSGVFDPTTTQPSVSLASGNAPQGHFIFNPFIMDRTAASGISGITPVTTAKRPGTGAWFQGRVWYSGVADSFQPTGDVSYYTWSENIYFSTVNIGNSTDFGTCYQTNDPTSEDLFGELPTDGGVVQIVGSGLIYKLYPIQNGMLVFAQNGIWFITGSQGIGFAANDFTVNKISSVEVLSANSFVDVLGLPYFWNVEGIYAVTPAQGNGLNVEPLTVGTIQTFYNDIPTMSKKYARGAYDPINYVIQWIYKTETEVSITDRYSFDGILNFNTYNKAFFPYTVDNTQGSINSITYVQGPETVTAPDPIFKYFASENSTGAYMYAFADEHDETYADWTSSGTPANYVSYFVTGYRIRGQGSKKSQSQYIYVWSRVNEEYSGYKIQGIWDYAFNPASGKFSNLQTSLQQADIANNNFGVFHKRHKIRGSGYTLQFKIQSQDGYPFDIVGWAGIDTVNQGA